MTIHKKSVLLVIFVSTVSSLTAAQEPVGIFDDHVDIGDVTSPGVAVLDGSLYTVDASGESIGDQVLTDEFHYVYKEISGSFVIEGSRLVTLTQALPDGYYVVLVVDRNGSRAHALHRLRRAAEVIANEIF